MAQTGSSHVQKLYVMRHGQRWDNAFHDWVHEPGVRTWDPPLTDAGVEQARSVGEKLRSAGVRIDRIFVSPFLRCVQTAAGFIQGMFTHDLSHLKVHIECGLSELMNRQAIWYPPADPSNGEIWTLPLDRLISELPSGTVVDVSAKPVVPKIPEWEEPEEEGRRRYVKTIYTVADQFPHDNILCISHGEGIKVSFKDQNPGVLVNYVRYCAYTEAERELFMTSPLNTGPWKMLTELGQKSGLVFRERSTTSTSCVRPSLGSQNDSGVQVVKPHDVVHIEPSIKVLPEIEAIV